MTDTQEFRERVGRIGRLRGGGQGADRRDAALYARGPEAVRGRGQARPPRRAVRPRLLIGADVAPARVLVRLPNWLGDAIMARPLLHALRVAWPAARIMGVGPEGPSAPIVGERLTDEFLPWPGDAAGRSAVIRSARAWRPDLAFVLPVSFSSAWLA